MERKKKKLIYNVVVSLLLITGLVWVCSHFVHLGNVAYTDNAQVKQLIVPVNSRVQGFIKKSISMNTGKYIKAILWS